MNVRPLTVVGSKPRHRVSLKDGMRHLMVCPRIYQHQLSRGAFFVHVQLAWSLSVGCANDEIDISFPKNLNTSRQLEGFS